jgi:alanine dehydrogenase
VTLILSEEDIEQVLRVEDCVRVLEETFRDFGLGHAVSRPRTHTYTYLEPDTFYNFKSMDGGVPRYGVHALRISSEVVQAQNHFGRLREVKLPRATGGRYVGLVMLFDIHTTEPLAIMQEAGIQRMRVGSTSAIAAKHIARNDAKRVGIFGTGWQAKPQITALAEVRDLELVKVYSLNPENRARFVAEMATCCDFPVVAAENPREVVEGADIVVCATNSQEPVFDGAWLQPGQHVNSLQAGELDKTTHLRADAIIVRAFEQSRLYVQSNAPQRPIHSAKMDSFAKGFDHKLIALGEIVAGQKKGRTSEQDITLFGGSGTGPSSGLGIQFAAVGKIVYDSARKKGLGYEIPTSYLTETHHP